MHATGAGQGGVRKMRKRSTWLPASLKSAIAVVARRGSGAADSTDWAAAVPDALPLLPESLQAARTAACPVPAAPPRAPGGIAIGPDTDAGETARPCRRTRRQCRLLEGHTAAVPWAGASATNTPSAAVAATNAPGTGSATRLPANILIRQMQLSDVSRCFHLGDEVFTDELLHTLYRTWDQYCVLEAYSSDPEYAFVAEDKNDNHALVGFVLGCSIMKRDKHATYGYVEWVAVRHSYQRLGIGTALVERVTLKLVSDGASQIMADTPANNVPACAFFHKLGYGDDVRHVYMEKHLDPRRIEEELRRARDLPPDRELQFETPEHVTIRMMTIDDVYHVFVLGETVFNEAFVNLYRLWDEHEVMDLFETDSELCLVAVAQGKLVGFALGTTIAKTAPNKSKMTIGYLVWLATDQACQKRGIGKALYTAVGGRFAGTPSVCA